MAERSGTPVAPAELYTVRRSVTRSTQVVSWRVWRGKKYVSRAFGTQAEALRCLDAILDGEKAIDAVFGQKREEPDG